MSSIDPASRVLAHIRAQALAWKGKSAASRSAAAPASGPAPSDWLGQVTASVIAIPRDAPDRGRRAFRAYLEALLARECGVRRVEDREFQHLVDSVVETMEKDASLKEAIQVAGEVLLRSAGA